VICGAALDEMWSGGQLILPSSNLNENTDLFHFAGITLAPSAKPETISKPLNMLFFGGNLFLGEWWFYKSLEN
jgi:hypothetical protein